VKFASFLVLGVLVACHSTPAAKAPVDLVEPSPAPPYNTSDRDGLGTAIGNACLQLRRLACPEGFPTATKRTCFEHFTVLSALADVPADCFKASPSVDVVRGCGTAQTHRVRCITP